MIKFIITLQLLHCKKKYYLTCFVFDYNNDSDWNRGLFKHILIDNRNLKGVIIKKILLSFIGNNDCLIEEGKKGAIISILETENFDVLYILYNNDHYLREASKILLYCRKNLPNLQVRYQSAESANPTDYNIVYPAIYKAVSEIIKEEGKADYSISVTSGTPVMHTCWVLLKLGGFINARLIQTSREVGISEITLSLNDFPKLKKEKDIKVELTKKDRENKYLKQKLGLEFDEIIGNHESIIRLKQEISSIAIYDTSIFITGESGTGKELVARAIHYNSPRKKEPFVSVNCGAISKNLFESQFFGHKKGAFTGSMYDHEGFFKQADGGTLFLDEISDLPLDMQVKLLRVLETKEVQPLGDKKFKVNVRIVSASHKNLKSRVIDKDFREDLYYRLVTGTIEILPLRYRGNDILLLANRFLDLLNKKYSANKHFVRQAEEKLLSYHWYGNVRELKNVVEYSFTRSLSELINKEDIIFANDLSKKESEFNIPDEGIDLDSDIIPKYYEAALKKTNGNQSKAAKLLGLEAPTFRQRLRKLNKDNNNYSKK